MDLSDRLEWISGRSERQQTQKPSAAREVTEMGEAKGDKTLGTGHPSSISFICFVEVQWKIFIRERMVNYISGAQNQITFWLGLKDIEWLRLLEIYSWQNIPSHWSLCKGLKRDLPCVVEEGRALATEQEPSSQSAQAQPHPQATVQESSKLCKVILTQVSHCVHSQERTLLLSCCRMRRDLFWVVEEGVFGRGQGYRGYVKLVSKCFISFRVIVLKAEVYPPNSELLSRSDAILLLYYWRVQRCVCVCVSFDKPAVVAI